MSITEHQVDQLKKGLGEFLRSRKGTHNPEHLKAKYEYNIVGFAKDILRVNLWSKQRELCGLVMESPLIYALSANGVGKTLTAVVIMLHHLYCCGPSMAVTVAATEKQLRTQFWGEAGRLWIRANLVGQL